MNLKKAQEYAAKILPVLAEHIREKYWLGFVAPQVEFDDRIPSDRFGDYDLSSRKIRIKGEGRIYPGSLVRTLAHELGHALSDQINPEFYWINSERNMDYKCLSEGIARVLEKEWVEFLKKQGLFSPSFLHDWILLEATKHYRKEERAVRKLMERHSLVEIMEHAHEPEFVHSIIGR